MPLPLLLLFPSLLLSVPPDPTKDCKLEWHERRLDNFAYSPGSPTFKQRVFVCGEDAWRPGGPIFFYCGNEANVTLYIQHTGLMWENRESFGAVLIFAEHRYYGASLPFGAQSFQRGKIDWMTHQQALADYAEVLEQFKHTRQAFTSKVVAFGGSYGGMLSAWMRMKYPGTVAGAISASAPLLAFPGLGHTSFNTPSSPGYGNTYWEVCTRTASPAAGARKNCDAAVRAAFKALFVVDRSALKAIFGTCDPIVTDEDLRALAYFILMAWDSMAMGNYPYPSNYMTNNGNFLPAYPMRFACMNMVNEDGTFPSDPEMLLRWMSIAINRYANASHVICYPIPKDIEQDGVWDWQWCTQLLPQETYFGKTGTTDMFWEDPFNMSWVNERCTKKYGVAPQSRLILTTYGPETALDQYSNIVFSNGYYDPWSAGGVDRNYSDSVVSITIAGGAHHLDLMFSNPKDPESVINARKFELAAIREWLR